MTKPATHAKLLNSPNNATKSMELVHSDVVGKLETSYNDFNYYVTFLDDFSKEIF